MSVADDDGAPFKPGAAARRETISTPPPPPATASAPPGCCTGGPVPAGTGAAPAESSCATASATRDEVARGARVGEAQAVDLRVAHAGLRLIDQRDHGFGLRDVVGRTGEQDRLSHHAGAHAVELMCYRARDVAWCRLRDANRLDRRGR
jgi:hypothetical protein